MNLRISWGAALLALLLLEGNPVHGAEPSESDTVTLYRERCASCHGERRYGGYAPPLIPETLKRKDDETLVRTVLKGLPNTQMPSFEGQLGETEARALVALLRDPVGEIQWQKSDIAASRVEETGSGRTIAPEVSRDNLVLVVERGSGSVVILDGDSMKELDRFQVGRIHGGIKFDRGLHKALAVTRDGTLVDYDLDHGRVRARVKVGVNTRNVAVSTRGDFIAAANLLPQGVVVLDAALRPLAALPLPGQPSAVYQLPGQDRFMLTLRDQPHLYTLDYPALSLQKVELPEAFEDFVFVPGKPQLVASSRKGSRLLLYDYDQHRILGSLPTEGLPHLFSASFFNHGPGTGSLHAAFNHMGVPRLSIIDMETFRVAKEIPLLGAGYFTRTHPGTPYLWIDSNTESIQLVDKTRLELVDRLLTPEPGKKAMHVEFTANGDRALVSVWHEDGALVVYDSTTLEELNRLPFAMPVGKYNAANKTRALR
jgi:mono/diheme cytochrome c family protein